MTDLTIGRAGSLIKAVFRIDRCLSLIGQLRRRLPLLVASDAARAVLTGAIVVLAKTGLLSLPWLVAVVFVIGFWTVIFEICYYSFVPSLVAGGELVRPTAAFRPASPSHSRIQPCVQAPRPYATERYRAFPPHVREGWAGRADAARAAGDRG